MLSGPLCGELACIVDAFSTLWKGEEERLGAGQKGVVPDAKTQSQVADAR